MATRRTKAAAVAGLLAGAMALTAGVTTEWFASFGGRPRRERLQRSPHFVEGKFRNPVPSQMLARGSFWQMMRRQLFGKEQRVPPKPVPVVMHVAADYAAPQPLRVTWLGHASALIELDGARVLTDPIWSQRCSPSTLVGPRRFHPPPIALGDLPPIDAVVISHDHYDHLDMATVRALGKRGTRFVVPLGVGAHFESWGLQATELDWDESVRVGPLTLTARPARHYSGRNPLHGSETLWASWVIKGPAHRAFFSGDSGYFDGFARTGVEHGPFDVALIKIGASDPTWQEIHMSPEEAVRASADLRARLLVPVHWGTFNLAFHDWNEPADRALAAARLASVPIVVPRPGELVDPARPQPVETWWR